MLQFLIVGLLIFLPSINSRSHVDPNQTGIDSSVTNDTNTIDDLDFKTNDSLSVRHSHHKNHDCPFVHGDFPIDLTDKEDPTKYFRCQQGASILFQCPAELKFDEYVRGCVWFLASPQVIRPPTPAPCGCVPAKPTSPPCPHVKPVPTTPPPCAHVQPSTTPAPKPTPPPCGCTTKPPVTKPPVTTPTPAPCNHAPMPCGCPTQPPMTTLKPKPAPCNHAPNPCGCSNPNPIPDPYTTKKPGQAPGPRPTPVAAIPKCPLDQSNSPVFIPHPTNSAKFYQCSWGTAFECQCSDGLIFHIGLQACGWPQAGPSKVIVANFDCFANDSGAVLLPHSTDSHKFYKIYQGAAYECCCPMSQIFKSESRNCGNFEVPVCPNDLGTNIIYLPHPDHRLFYECATGKVNLFYCSTGTFFHPDKKSCITAKINL